MTTWAAIVNTPGYLPDSDEPPATFNTPFEAWSHLADDRTRHEDELADGDASYSETRETLAVLGTTAHWQTTDRDNPGADVRAWLASHGIDTDGTGSVHGPTPGYEGSHDLGINYEVRVLGPNG